MSHTFQAHGKLLLTAEYFVLDSALALALPVKYGQSLTVSKKKRNGKEIHWEGIDEQDHSWFEATFDPDLFEILHHNNEEVAKRLQAVFIQIKKLNPDFLPSSFHCKTKVSFPRNWGLGTSSTLIFLLARWAEVNPYQLQFRTFGGSGYDIACAGAKGPILYQKENEHPQVTPCDFDPPFADSLYFLFLGKKQNSREGIRRFEGKSNKEKEKRDLTEVISDLTIAFLNEKELKGFETLIIVHEELVSRFIDLPRAKTLYFNDFWGEIKSLGAWGGDFVLATSDRPIGETRHYFNEKGFEVLIPYEEMVFK